MRIAIAIIILLMYLLLCYGCWARYRRRHPVQTLPASLAQKTFAQNAHAQKTSWVVAYASQTGTAEHIAQLSVRQLEDAGLVSYLVSLNHLDPALLIQAAGVLFVVSTYGEGEAPDNGNRFVNRLTGLDFSQVSYGILALGDDAYPRFCAFGHQLHHRLHQAGARELFDLIEVNRRDPSSLRHWQYYLGQLTGQSHFADWDPPVYETWRLKNRRCINTGSPGNPVFFLQLVPKRSILLPQWQAGDIAEIGPCNSSAAITDFLQQHQLDGALPITRVAITQPLAEWLRRKDLRLLSDDIISSSVNAEYWLDNLADLPHREYSIASTSNQPTLDLLVRQHGTYAEGFGLGSGWLTHYAQVGEDILLRIRTNPQFHPPALDAPMILIGNGTGIAGLRAHLLHRIGQQNHQNWLIFGERNPNTDFFFGEEIKSWYEKKYLQRMDLVFSRSLTSNIAARYVQDLLMPAEREIQQWIAQGGVIYVCGSLQGMAQGVDQVLAQILGRDQLDALAEARRYCRDVY